MCKEILVILVNKVVDPKRIIGKKWSAVEEERHKGSLTQKRVTLQLLIVLGISKLYYLSEVFAMHLYLGTYICYSTSPRWPMSL
jgi:hypothetical protein